MGTTRPLAFQTPLRTALAALIAAAAGVSCREPTGPDYGVRSLSIMVQSTVLRPGLSMPATVVALDAEGLPVVDVPVRWRSLNPDKVSVDDTGAVRAHAPGRGRIRASVGTVAAELELLLVNPPAATVAISVDTVRLTLGASSVPVAVDARDAQGEPLVAPATEWESTNARIASVTATGLVGAVASGAAFAIVHVGDVADSAVVLVTPPVSPNAPVIVEASPATAVPGQSLVVTGERFSPTTGGNAVRLDGVALQVVGATPTQLTLQLPQAGAFTCAPTGPATLQVTTPAGTGIGTVTLQMAPQRTLARGQSIVVPGGLESRCVELMPAEGRYVISVQNTARAIGTSDGAVSLFGVATPTGAPLVEGPGGRASASAAASAVAPSSVVAPAEPRIISAGDLVRTVARGARRMQAHARVLEANARAARAFGTTARAADVTLAGRAAAGFASLSVGSLQPIRIANLEAASICNAYVQVGTRTAYLGPHLAILEDTAPTVNGDPSLRGQLDDLYQQIGEEFEASIWPMLQVFGDPLAMDSRLDADGRLAVVFSPRLNEMLGGSLLAFTTTCDFRQRQEADASNVGEYVYAQVPTSTVIGHAPGSRERWLWLIRGTLAHEFKHLVGYAERRLRPELPPEEAWLEEATARHAEELFARAAYGTVIRGNHGFDATLDCEATAGLVVRPPGCDGSPRAMLPLFEGLWDFLDLSTLRSPLGPTSADDFTYYGSAWSLTRWMLDHSGLPEPQFFQPITRSLDTGIRNLESRIGRSWQDMIGEWSLALATDDLPGLDPEAPRLRFPSWDLPSVFSGLCATLGPCVTPSTVPNLYPRADPLRRTVVGVGDFVVEYSVVRAGGFGIVEVAGGTAATRQLLGLRGYRGRALPADARMAVIRVE